MTPLPDWARAAYAVPGVEAALLDLQDGHGQSVLLLLWAAWRRSADPGEAADAAALIRTWEEGAIGPLRRARRWLKGAEPPLPAPVRASVAAAELELEMHVLALLAGLEGPPAARLEEALVTAAAAWGGDAPEVALHRLARLLPAFS